MLQRILLYWNTVRYMKPSQVYYRLRKMARLSCTLGVVPTRAHGGPAPVSTIPELDFDPVFLARFPVEGLMADRITLLHESESFFWNAPWSFPNRTPLWNYNLHYFEYAFPLVKAYRDTGNERYLEKLKDILRAWIENNPRERGGTGWDAYPIALRLTNWLSIYTYLQHEIDGDADFRKLFIHSLWEQYDHLARRLEKDLLGNHYFEDLKALILCALFFGDEDMLKGALAEFHRQCREQILPDGMHFELSPMYHKIILEDVMRVAAALRGADKRDEEIEAYLQPMLDAAYSPEEGLDRIPLFNDCGNNVAKSLDALCAAAKAHFGLTPAYRDRFPDSGYYIFRQNDWKLIVDAGQPGPAYLPGHAHCDAMSFELFRAGKPVLVNCGTYAYQCRERAFFRSTAAHNTVMVEGMEQSQCWGVFRMGRRSRVEIKKISENAITMEMTDQFGQTVERKISLRDGHFQVKDKRAGKSLRAYIHFLQEDGFGKLADVWSVVGGECNQYKQNYAAEYGMKKEVTVVELSGEGMIEFNFTLEKLTT